MLKYSVIILVYNVRELSSSGCINSILVQEYTDLEILLIDKFDLLDSSGSICDTYASEYQISHLSY